MNTTQLTQIVTRLRKQGSDDGQVEVKASATGLSQDIWESICAFANTHGGLIILGLEENRNFEPVENFKLNRVLDQLVSGLTNIVSEAKITPTPAFEAERIDFEDNQVICLTIEELDVQLKPCFIKARGKANGSFKRLDDMDLRLSPAEIYELENTLLPSASDSAPVEQATLEDLDMEHVKFALTTYAKNSRVFKNTNSLKAQMHKAGLINKDESPTLTGLLCFGKWPQQFFPRLCIDVAAHPGTTRGASGPVRFLDRITCEGPMAQMLDDAVKAVLKNLRTLSYVHDVNRIDVPQIPPSVLREALTNAVVHREYSAFFKGAAVTVDIFEDRVEIVSPGGLWGGKTLTNLADGQSFCRNEFLMRTMAMMESESPAEGRGSGVPYMIEEMRRFSLPSPSFSSNDTSFKVTFARENPVPPELKKQLGAVKPEAPAQSNSESVQKPVNVLDILGEDALTIRELASATGKKMSTLRAQLAKLVRQGAVIAHGKPTSPNRSYTLPK